jgi:transcription initiation factor TFIIE subunit alpha
LFFSYLAYTHPDERFIKACAGKTSVASSKKVKKPVRTKAKSKPAKPLKKAIKARPKASKESTTMMEEVVAEVAGKDVLQLVRVLRNKKNVSEFTLAEAVKREINATRNMLYRLYENNLVNFIRKKDKKKGWYIYYWTFNPPRIKEIYINLKKKKLEKLLERLAREKNTQFYVCYAQETQGDGSVKQGSVTMRLDFDQAVNYDFKCPETGQLLELEDNSDRIRQISGEIEQLKKEIKDYS